MQVDQGASGSRCKCIKVRVDQQSTKNRADEAEHEIKETFHFNPHTP